VIDGLVCLVASILVALHAIVLALLHLPHPVVALALSGALFVLGVVLLKPGSKD
jgi:hypothetical protein